MIISYVFLFLFDLILLFLVLRVFAEKRHIRKEIARLSDSETSILELVKSMEHLVDEYKRAADNIQEDISSKQNDLMQTIHRADRLLMELVRRSDRFEVSIDNPPQTKPKVTKSTRQKTRKPAVSKPIEQIATEEAIEEKVTLAGKQLRDERDVHSRPATQGSPSLADIAPRVKKPIAFAADEAQPASGPRPTGIGQIHPKQPPQTYANTRRKGLFKPTKQPSKQPITDAGRQEMRSEVEDPKMPERKRLVKELSKQGLDVETIA
ncbi:hypothetical protein J7M28_04325 [bacterium]|nr:hypothetical protein [bacterium]